MPFFDFKCYKCNIIVEKFIKEDTIQICTVCEAAMDKLMGTPAFNLIGGKNSGFDTPGFHAKPTKKNA
jgi:predicted nucleic acid-binding Zn ribbon protein